MVTDVATTTSRLPVQGVNSSATISPVPTSPAPTSPAPYFLAPSSPVPTSSAHLLSYTPDSQTFLHPQCLCVVVHIDDVLPGALVMENGSARSRSRIDHIKHRM